MPQAVYGTSDVGPLGPRTPSHDEHTRVTCRPRFVSTVVSIEVGLLEAIIKHKGGRGNIYTTMKGVLQV